MKNYTDFAVFQVYKNFCYFFLLDTFKAWAGKSSDISYYLNSHHIDFHVTFLFVYGPCAELTENQDYGLWRTLFVIFVPEQLECKCS